MHEKNIMVDLYRELLTSVVKVFSCEGNISANERTTKFGNLFVKCTTDFEIWKQIESIIAVEMKDGMEWTQALAQLVATILSLAQSIPEKTTYVLYGCIIVDYKFKFYEFVFSREYLASINAGKESKENLVINHLNFDQIESFDYTKEPERHMVYRFFKCLLNTTAGQELEGQKTKKKLYSVRSKEINE